MSIPNLNKLRQLAGMPVNENENENENESSKTIAFTAEELSFINDAITYYVDHEQEQQSDANEEDNIIGLEFDSAIIDSILQKI